jgi:hypothetical protein
MSTLPALSTTDRHESPQRRAASPMPPFHSPRSASSAMINFLDLPVRIRNAIYERVLIVPHPLYLFQEPSSWVEIFAPETRSHWLALLYTNRQIHHEANSALYETNQFHFVDITQQQLGVLQSFLDCIGPLNAALLSHLCINFPVVECVDGQTGNTKLRDDSQQSLKLLRDKCTKLSTLEILVHYKNDGIFRNIDSSFQDALLAINAHLNTIPSLEKIIVRIVVRDGIPTTAQKDIMQGLGWAVIC